jgi:hypothetical protein
MNMKSTKSLSAALMIAMATLGACAGDAPLGNGYPVDPLDPNGPGGGPNDTAMLEMSGQYELSSKFDIASNMPGAAGAVLNEFIKATDGGDDPARYLVDKVLQQLPGGIIRDTLSLGAGLAVGYVNNQLNSLAPEFLPKILAIGNTLGDVTKNFGTISELSITGTGTALKGTHTVSGLKFKIDNQELPFLLADYGGTVVRAENIDITVEPGGKVTVGSHMIPISFGTVMRIALDEAVIPMVDPSAHNLGELFQNLVDCQQVGQAVFDAINFGSASTFENACKGGLTLAANTIYNQISQINGAALQFEMSGACRGIDKDQDGTMDELQRGAWAGQLSYAGAPAPLANASFTAAR